jgi:hypothetical protein
MATPQAGLYDLDDIAAHLRQRAEEWIPEHFPYGRRTVTIGVSPISRVTRRARTAPA